ncbi:MAG TPA: maleylpyruvate isomerase N-terminal domain-containing protein [Chloroflexota bacterium]|nr:maleylpyruvate isomerase N-terminal domain-containing protein [Chloroflexota bacterium]
MAGVGNSDLQSTAAICARTLEQVAGHDWSVRAAELDWTVGQTLSHVAGCLMNYAASLASRTQQQLPFRMSPPVRRDGTPMRPADLIQAMEVAAAILGAVVAEAAPDARGYHVTGLADPEGFAAMGCDEMLVHTEDIMNAFSLSFHPPPDLCRAVLARLFPWAPEAAPWDALLWANGRRALPGHARLGRDWAWQGPPLSEWDGTIKTYRD